MKYSITKKQLSPQSVLVVRRTVKRSEIGPTIGEVLPGIFQYAQQNGIALEGAPFARYVEANPESVTMEPGMCVAPSSAAKAQSSGEIVSGTLAGGLAATTTHAGPYEKLPEAYAAIEEWAKAEGLALAGEPWESYVTDPGNYPDPKDWKTEVFWPLR